MPDDLLTRARLDIRDGVIHYGLYQQDGSMQAMTCRDTLANRLFVSWVKAHDRMGGFPDPMGAARANRSETPGPQENRE